MSEFFCQNHFLYVYSTFFCEDFAEITTSVPYESKLEAKELASKSQVCDSVCDRTFKA
jgi:hypothetical protein